MRDKQGRFKPGTSGNPAGRPQSRDNEATKKIKAAKGDVVDAVIARAIRGDNEAARVLMDLAAVRFKRCKPGDDLLLRGDQRAAIFRPRIVMKEARQ